jgi:hypothetical protein
VVTRKAVDADYARLGRVVVEAHRAHSYWQMAVFHQRVETALGR